MDKYSTNPRQKLFNIYMIISLSTMAFYIAVFVVIDAIEATYNLIGFIGLFVIAYLLYNIGYKGIGIFLSGASSVAVVCIQTLIYFGTDSGFHFEIFALLIVLYIISDFNDNSQKISSLIVSIAAVIAFFICDSSHAIGQLEVIKEGVPSFIRNSALFITGFTMIFVMYYYSLQLSRKEATLYRLANHDMLTDIYNRRYYLKIGLLVFNRYKKTSKRFSVILMDLDDFKQINDTHGHHVGDLVLKKYSSVVNSHLMPDQVFARYGGEEFAIISPSTSAQEAFDFAETLRCSVNSNKVVYKGKIVPFSASFGVAEVTDQHQNFDQLMNLADKLLYQAKAQGKDCVKMANTKE